KEKPVHFFWTCLMLFCKNCRITVPNFIITYFTSHLRTSSYYCTFSYTKPGHQSNIGANQSTIPYFSHTLYIALFQIWGIGKHETVLNNHMFTNLCIC